METHLGKSIVIMLCIVQIIFSGTLVEAKIEFGRQNKISANIAPQMTYPADVNLSDVELSEALRNVREFYAIPLSPDDPKSMSDKQVVDEVAELLKKDSLQRSQAVEASESKTPVTEIPPELPPFDMSPGKEQRRLARLASSVVMYGQKRAAFESMKAVVERLRMPGDPTKWTLEFSATPLPNAFVYIPEPGKEMKVGRMGFTAGLLGFANNPDEIASVLAHEMTHANPKHMQTPEKAEEMERILGGVSGYKEMSPQHQEELRADLGAADRMIKAGYNPWAAYDLQKRFETLQRGLNQDRLMGFITSRIFKQNAAYTSTHPASEVRNAALKAFMLYKKGRVDMSEITAKYSKFSPGMKILNLRLGAYTWGFTNPWAIRGQGVSIVYEGLSAVGATSSALWKALEARGAELALPVKEVAKPFTNVAGDLYSRMTGVFGSGWEAVKGVAPNVNGWDIAVATWAATLSFITYKLGQAALFPKAEVIREIKQAVVIAKEMEKSARALSAASDPQRRIELMVDIGKSLNEIDKNFARISKDHQVLQSLSYINGLAMARHAATRLRADALAGIAQNMKEIPKASREKLIKTVVEVVGNTPGYVQATKRFAAADKLFFETAFEGKDLEAARGAERAYLDVRDLRQKYQKRSDLSVEDRFKLMVALKREKVPYFAGRILDENIPRFVEHAFGKEKASKGDAKIFIELFNEHKQSVDQIVRGEGNEADYDRRLIVETIKAWARGPAAAFAAKGMSAGIIKLRPTIAPITLSTKATRALFDLANTKVIARFFDRNFNSITEVADYIEKELVPRNIPTERLAPEFFAAVKAHPEWIKSRADVDALLKSRAFWPAMDGLEGRLGTMEQHLYQKIREAAQANPKMWEFEPGASEALHRISLEGLKASGQFPKTFEERKALWKSMTSRGITSSTDKLYSELFSDANPLQKAELKKLAVDGYV